MTGPRLGPQLTLHISITIGMVTMGRLLLEILEAEESLLIHFVVEDKVEAG